MRKPEVTLITVLTVTALLFLVAPAALSAPLATAVVIADADTYIDRINPDTTHNGALLLLQPGGLDPNPAKVVLLKFDLNGVGFSIAKARLNLGVIDDPLGCVTPSSIVSEINVYNMTAAFAADTATWNNSSGLKGTLRDDLDETTYTPPTHLHWTDTGSNSLASYLETQRGAGQSAYLWLEIPTGTGLEEVWFEDQEGTGQGAGCTGANLKPTLQLASADSPLAVTLATFHAADSGPNWSLVAGLVGIVGAALSVSILLRRRYAVRRPNS